MRTRWLRGTLLGLSLAVLLASGVALAQGALSMDVSPDCLECQPRAEGWPPPAERILSVTFNGYDPAYFMCARLMMPGYLWGEGCWGPTELPDPPCTIELAVVCETQELEWINSTCSDGAGQPAFVSGDVSALAVPGEWVWRMWQQTHDMPPIDPMDGAVFASNIYAETCVVVEEEFVPEPGTVLLLGSGLAGLAGYATLRWRTRE